MTLPWNKHNIISIEKAQCEVVKSGYGEYLIWTAYCERCDKNVKHTEPMRTSFPDATCENGHHSFGDKLKVVNKKKKK
jgi:hypothetical protein